MLKSIRQSAFALTAVLALAGCTLTSTQGNEDVRSQIEAANVIFGETFARGDASGMAGLYTADAVLLPSQSDSVTGTEAIAAFWQGAFDAGLKGAKLTTVEVEAFGDTANELGTYELYDADGNTADHGKYVVIWKHRDGGWKLHWDIFNTSVVPQ